MGIKEDELLCLSCARWKDCEFHKTNLGEIVSKDDLRIFIRLVEQEYKYVKDFVLFSVHDNIHLSAVECERWKW